jgi:hypothetical protein
MEKLTDAIGELQEMSARTFSTGEKYLAWSVLGSVTLLFRLRSGNVS